VKPQNRRRAVGRIGYEDRSYTNPRKERLIDGREAKRFQ